MIDLRVAQPTLVEAAGWRGGGLPEMREKKDRIQMRAYTASLTGSDIYAIHGAAEGHYSRG